MLFCHKFISIVFLYLTLQSVDCILEGQNEDLANTTSLAPESIVSILSNKEVPKSQTSNAPVPNLSFALATSSVNNGTTFVSTDVKQVKSNDESDESLSQLINLSVKTPPDEPKSNLSSKASVNLDNKTKGESKLPQPIEQGTKLSSNFPDTMETGVNPASTLIDSLNLDKNKMEIDEKNIESILTITPEKNDSETTSNSFPILSPILGKNKNITQNVSTTDIKNLAVTVTPLLPSLTSAPPAQTAPKMDNIPINQKIDPVLSNFDIQLDPIIKNVAPKLDESTEKHSQSKKVLLPVLEVEPEPPIGKVVINETKDFKDNEKGDQFEPTLSPTLSSTITISLDNLNISKLVLDSFPSESLSSTSLKPILKPMNDSIIEVNNKLDNSIGTVPTVEPTVSPILEKDKGEEDQNKLNLIKEEKNNTNKSEELDEQDLDDLLHDKLFDVRQFNNENEDKDKLKAVSKNDDLNSTKQVSPAPALLANSSLNDVPIINTNASHNVIIGPFSIHESVDSDDDCNQKEDIQSLLKSLKKLSSNENYTKLVEDFEDDIKDLDIFEIHDHIDDKDIKPIAIAVLEESSEKDQDHLSKAVNIGTQTDNKLVDTDSDDISNEDKHEIIEIHEIKDEDEEEKPHSVVVEHQTQVIEQLHDDTDHKEIKIDHLVDKLPGAKVPLNVVKPRSNPPMIVSSHKTTYNYFKPNNPVISPPYSLPYKPYRFNQYPPYSHGVQQFRGFPKIYSTNNYPVVNRQIQPIRAPVQQWVPFQRYQNPPNNRIGGQFASQGWNQNRPSYQIQNIWSPKHRIRSIVPINQNTFHTQYRTQIPNNSKRNVFLPNSLPYPPFRPNPNLNFRPNRPFLRNNVNQNFIPNQRMGPRPMTNPVPLNNYIPQRQVFFRPTPYPQVNRFRSHTVPSRINMGPPFNRRPVFNPYQGQNANRPLNSNIRPNNAPITNMLNLFKDNNLNLNKQLPPNPGPVANSRLNAVPIINTNPIPNPIISPKFVPKTNLIPNQAPLPPLPPLQSTQSKPSLNLIAPNPKPIGDSNPIPNRVDIPIPTLKPIIAPIPPNLAQIPNINPKLVDITNRPNGVQPPNLSPNSIELPRSKPGPTILSNNNARLRPTSVAENSTTDFDYRYL